MRKAIKGKKSIPLCDLPPGQYAEILQFPADTPVKMRLQEMGFIPGQKIQKIRSAPLGDPLEFTVMDYQICLRKNDAELVPVNPLE